MLYILWNLLEDWYKKWTQLLRVYMLWKVYTRNLQWWLPRQCLVSSFSSYSLGYLDCWGTGDLVAIIPAWRSQFQCSDLFVCLGVSHSSLTPHGITVDWTRDKSKGGNISRLVSSHIGLPRGEGFTTSSCNLVGCDWICPPRQSGVVCSMWYVFVVNRKERRQWRWPASGWSSLYGSLLWQKLFTKPGTNYTMSSNFIHHLNDASWYEIVRKL